MFPLAAFILHYNRQKYTRLAPGRYHTMLMAGIIVNRVACMQILHMFINLHFQSSADNIVELLAVMFGKMDRL